MVRWRSFAAAWLPVLLWMALILTLSARSDFPAQSNPVTGETIRSTYALAKTAHVVEYRVLGGLLYRAARAPGGGLALPPARAAAWSVIAAATLGAADELRQSLVPNRSPRLSDVLIDGASALAMAAVLLARNRRRLRGRAATRVVE